ncbi:hypothetical protein JHK84_049865 [Glycine max]|nr:hypothetical protein JHK84_049865 [Glycine max]
MSSILKSREDKLTLAKNKEKLSRNVKLFQQKVFDTRASLSMSCLQFIRSRPLGKTWSLIRVVAGWVVNNTSLKQANVKLQVYPYYAIEKLNYQYERSKLRWMSIGRLATIRGR